MQVLILKTYKKLTNFFNFHIFHILIRINKRSFYILYIIFLYITVLDDCLYEFIIISCLGEQVKYSFCSFICLKAVKGFPHYVYCLKFFLIKKKVFSSCTRLGYVYCGNTLFSDNFLSSTSSILPVPLNSSNTTSSIYFLFQQVLLQVL